MPLPRRTPIVPGDHHCAVFGAGLRLEQLYLDLQQPPCIARNLPEVQEARPARLPARSACAAPRRDLHAEPHPQ